MARDFFFGAYVRVGWGGAGEVGRGRGSASPRRGVMTRAGRGVKSSPVRRGKFWFDPDSLIPSDQALVTFQHLRRLLLNALHVLYPCILPVCHGMIMFLINLLFSPSVCTGRDRSLRLKNKEQQQNRVSVDTCQRKKRFPIQTLGQLFINLPKFSPLIRESRIRYFTPLSSG